MVELQIVVLVVAGSIPVGHPSLILFLRFLLFWTAFFITFSENPSPL